MNKKLFNMVASQLKSNQIQKKFKSSEDLLLKIPTELRDLIIV